MEHTQDFLCVIGHLFFVDVHVSSDVVFGWILMQWGPLLSYIKFVQHTLIPH